jgi:hypothetical protein
MNNQISQVPPPIFSNAVFWDVDASKIDWNAKAQFVIERALTRGRWVDVQTAFSYYGAENVKKALLAAHDLDVKTWHFWSNYFEIPLTDFRCSTLTHSLRELWPH